MENIKPAWFKYARHEIQQVYNWLAEREPELAAWWDGTTYHLHSKFAWGGQAEDIVLVCRNKDDSQRHIAYKLVEIAHEGDVDEGRVCGPTTENEGAVHKTDT